MLVVDAANEADLPAVLALNQAALPHVSALTLEALRRLHGWSGYFQVARDGGQVVGFLLTLREGCPYRSLNYQWFAERYPRFLYIDRVAIADSHHRRGLGTRLYEDLHGFAERRVPLVACEVNTRPANDASLAFHERLGYRPVGSQETEGGTKSVCLMIRAVSDAG